MRRKLTPALLQEWGKAGFIPAPGEEEDDFVKRVDFLESFKKNPYPFLIKKGWSKSDQLVSEAQWEPVFEELKKKVGCAPQWLISFYSNRHLKPWYGALSWIYTQEMGIRFPLIQLNKRFAKGRYLGYQCKEVLFHEALHGLRSAYPDSRFEEILAYSTSRKKWRRFLGPLFRHPRQMVYLTLWLGLFFLAQVGCSVFLASKWRLVFEWLSLSPLLYLFSLFVLLIRDQRLFKRALKTICCLVNCKKSSFAIAFRLTDEEIKRFAQCDKSDVRTYIRKQTSLRWQQILLEFPLLSADL